VANLNPTIRKQSEKTETDMWLGYLVDIGVLVTTFDLPESGPVLDALVTLVQLTRSLPE
jgi:hypothetical protein